MSQTNREGKGNQPVSGEQVFRAHRTQKPDEHTSQRTGRDLTKEAFSFLPNSPTQVTSHPTLKHMLFQMNVEWSPQSEESPLVCRTVWSANKARGTQTRAAHSKHSHNTHFPTLKHTDTPNPTLLLPIKSYYILHIPHTQTSCEKHSHTQPEP